MAVLPSLLLLFLRGDVHRWSCRVVLFVLKAGHLPFYGRNPMAMCQKIYEGEFRCPCWFSPELIGLLRRLVVPNPAARMSIPEIMENRWFKKGYRPLRFYIENDKFYSLNDLDSPSVLAPVESDSEPPSPVVGQKVGLGLPRPASLNAFDIISFSRWFDLSGLFEERGEVTRFISREPVAKIIGQLEEIARVVRFTVRKRDCRVSLKGEGYIDNWY